uniref:Uncharacterized protein n=1 Tax=Moschus moschiferus TaxID=68415 RepID=A0A8C6E194_MOSMO
MMELWFPTRSVFNPTNSYWSLPSHTLHVRYNNRFLISHPYLPRRKLRLNHPIFTRQWSLHILYLPVHTRRTRNILRFSPSSIYLNLSYHPRSPHF